jgi:DNA-binding winged helix-turn-helix (wHTH) protein
MSQAAATPGIVSFDRFRLDLRSGELYKSGRKIRLQAQPCQVLAMLLEHAGNVVTREELRQRLWPGDTFVDFDHSLNTAIKKLRQALCETADRPRLIETLPRRGYRFLGAITGADRAPTTPPPPSSSWTGKLAKLHSPDHVEFVLLPVDSEALREREKLDAANDDVGLSLLIASQRVLMVPAGTPMRVLDASPSGLACQVRILDGEHYGKLALVPRKNLALAR